MLSSPNLPESSWEPFKYRFITSYPFRRHFYYFRSDRSRSSSADYKWITPYAALWVTLLILVQPSSLLFLQSTISCSVPVPSAFHSPRFQILNIGRYLLLIYEQLYQLGLRLGLVIEMTSLWNASNRSTPGLFVSNGELWCVEVPICTRRRGWSSWTSHRRCG